MNERILEFAIQSGLPTALDYHQKRYEKFAELIVRECADICYNREYTDGTRYGDEIIEHFGVE